MFKVTLMVLAVIVFKAKFTNSVPLNIIDDALAELESLEQTVLGAILVAEDELDYLKQSLLTYSYTIEKIVALDLAAEQQKINDEINTVKNLATSANADISSCFQGIEEYLNTLPTVILNELKECYLHENEEGSKVVTASQYLINILINRVHLLEFALNLCDKDSEECISPIVEKIELETVQIPQEIEIELVRATDLFEELKVTVNYCGDLKLSQYITNATSVVKFVTSCAENIIG